MAHSRGHLGAVALDLHPPAAAVAELAPREIAVHVLRAQLETGRKALYDCREAGAVRLAGGGEADGHGPQNPTRERVVLLSGLVQRVPVGRVVVRGEVVAELDIVRAGPRRGVWQARVERV